MSNMRELLAWATTSLKEASIESPQLDAEVLLAHSLGATRSALYTVLGEKPHEETEDTFKALVARRLRHEPVAYITGQKEFFGLDFQVDPRVLIPRPETETLVEVVLTIARQKRVPVLAEVGVGSGAVAVPVRRQSHG